MLSAIHAFSSRAPALANDGFGRGEKGKRAGKRICLRNQHEGENFILDQHSLSDEDETESLDFWCVKGSKNAELSHASDSNHADTNREMCNCLGHICTWIQ